jgi:hypothetical protein
VRFQATSGTNRRRWLVLICGLLGCGTNSFSESSDGQDFPGTAPWVKVDQRPDRPNALGIQSVSFAAPLGDELHDPCVIEVADGSLVLYYASSASGAIGRTHAPAGTSDWERGSIVLRATEPWEAGTVRGFSVLERDGRFEGWYAGGDGAGIGRAVSDDGIRWTKEPTSPVLRATEPWEAGAVRAPGVSQAPDGRLWMVYEAGDGQALGAAWSDDGIRWERGGLASSGTGAALERGQPGAWDEARVAAPSLRIEVSSTGRTVFRMWYEGMAGNDFSVGEAASYDGVEWVRSPYNPVLAESPPLALTIGADEREPWVLGAIGSRQLWFVGSQLEPPAQGIGLARDGSP